MKIFHPDSNLEKEILVEVDPFSYNQWITWLNLEPEDNLIFIEELEKAVPGIEVILLTAPLRLRAGKLDDVIAVRQEWSKQQSQPDKKPEPILVTPEMLVKEFIETYSIQPNHTLYWMGIGSFAAVNQETFQPLRDYTFRFAIRNQDLTDR